MPFDLSSVILLIFALALSVTTISIIYSSTILGSILLMSTSSLLITLCYLTMDAPDIAMTEAAIGACLSTVIMLSFAKNIDYEISHTPPKTKILALLLCTPIAFIIIYAIGDLTPYGAYNPSLQAHINNYYIQNTATDIGIPSFVAAILASYRGYDTLGETTVILTAAISILLILKNTKKKNAK
jgi:multicomponent Na+:H+ antiporter subunit B